MVKAKKALVWAAHAVGPYIAKQNSAAKPANTASIILSSTEGAANGGPLSKETCLSQKEYMVQISSINNCVKCWGLQAPAPLAPFMMKNLEKKRKAKLHRSLVGRFELSSWHDLLQTHVINYMQLQCLSIIGIQICKHTSQWNHPQGQGFSLAQVDAFAMSLLHLNVGPFHDQPCVQFKDLTWWCFGLPGRHLISSNIYADSHGPTFKMVCQHPNLVRIHHDITR